MEFLCVLPRPFPLRTRFLAMSLDRWFGHGTPWAAVITMLFPVVWLIEKLSRVLKALHSLSAPEEEVNQLAMISAEEGSLMPNRNSARPPPKPVISAPTLAALVKLFQSRAFRRRFTLR